MKEMMSVWMHVWKTSFSDVENKNKNCPKIDENEAIFINLQFVLRARHYQMKSLSALVQKQLASTCE